MRFALILFALLITFAQSSYAYFVAVPSEQAKLDYSKPTRILFSGRGTDLGLQPQMSALGTALLYRINFPQDQVVLISVFENEQNEQILVDAKWRFVAKNERILETQSAVPEIAKFKKIRSLEFFGHNSPSLGTQADGRSHGGGHTNRFDFLDPLMDSLTPNFTAGAFAIIHGCNSGWILAPKMAEVWKIPVGSSFTETRFEHLHSDGHFYVYDNTKAPSPAWSNTNPDLGNANCDFGGCIRQRPRFSYYQGSWGNFEGPSLSHYKFFCRLEVKECEKRMALSLFGFVAEHSLKPGASLSDFREVAKQYLCPVYPERAQIPNRRTTEECLTNLDEIERGHGDPFAQFSVNSKQLVCDFKGCKAVMTCTSKCTIADRVSKNSTTLSDEYMHFINGFKALQAEGLK